MLQRQAGGGHLPTPTASLQVGGDSGVGHVDMVGGLLASADVFSEGESIFYILFISNH